MMRERERERGSGCDQCPVPKKKMNQMYEYI